MKVYNKKHNNLTENIQTTLAFLRQMRGFNVKTYIEGKTEFLNEYMKNNSLSSCVVAVSGGIDSALVLSLVVEAQKQKNSPIKKIVAISLPVLNSEGATNQVSATSKAQKLCDKLGVELLTYEVNKSFQEIFPQVETGLNQTNHDNWARGQLVAYARTPFLYYTTSVLSSQGFGSIIVGTTNRDEGAYLGYVGKASDGMVDIQLISDLHKSEVQLASEYLGVVEDIITAIPSGDMYDGRIDEEVFGAPYDFVELYLNYKNMNPVSWASISYFWNEKDKQEFNDYSTALEKLHKYNQHKYWSGSQAIHLDILNSAVKDGWIDGIHSSIHKSNNNKIIPTHRFIGFVDQAPELNVLKNNLVINKKESINVIDGLLQADDIQSIIDWRNNNQSKMVRTNQYGRIEIGDSGSNRLSFYSQEFVSIIEDRLRLFGGISDLMIFNQNDDTNWRPFKTWRFKGINPMVRLMEYENNDYLVPHYDDSFYESDIQRSLFTLVIIIQNKCEGGATRFLKDIQDLLPFENRIFNDWTTEANESDIKYSIKPNAGNALLFPHRKLHDGERVSNGKKIILRTELMFEACTSNFLKK